MKKFVLKILTWVALKGRFYYTWSRIYRWLWERKWRRTEIPVFLTFDEISAAVGRVKWRRDGYRELWDAVSTPRAAYGKFLAGEEAGDCDDISIFGGYCINRADEAKLLGKTIWKIGLLSCPWLDSKGKVGGHNVCAFAYQENGGVLWAHISNWDQGRIRWGFKELRDVVQNVLDERNTTTIGWAFASLDLKLKEYHWNL